MIRAKMVSAILEESPLQITPGIVLALACRTMDSGIGTPIFFNDEAGDGSVPELLGADLLLGIHHDEELSQGAEAWLRTVIRIYRLAGFLRLESNIPQRTVDIVATPSGFEHVKTHGFDVELTLMLDGSQRSSTIESLDEYRRKTFSGEDDEEL